jgi:hypothetical protein
MTKAIDLSDYVQAVWRAVGLRDKQTAMFELIEASHAKADTKRLYTAKVRIERDYRKLDNLASNYAMSGEGMKVR